mmetsp:Transcript_31862/g.84196  ORF Transcript_31862/g.84196 Transcript_31862/m.84196 type:complete len:226 (-) Transcript_31862:271-948(-)
MYCAYPACRSPFRRCSSTRRRSCRSRKRSRAFRARTCARSASRCRSGCCRPPSTCVSSGCAGRSACSMCAFVTGSSSRWADRRARRSTGGQPGQSSGRCAANTAASRATPSVRCTRPPRPARASSLLTTRATLTSTRRMWARRRRLRATWACASRRPRWVASTSRLSSRRLGSSSACCTTRPTQRAPATARTPTRSTGWCTACSREQHRRARLQNSSLSTATESV